jgi:hypothetical protein
VGIKASFLISYRVLESMKAGKRLSETPFAKLELAAKGQQSVYSIFKGKRSGTVSAGNDS